MSRLTEDVDIQSNVDWQTEAVRRYSEASISGQLFSSVNMNNPMRLEKVCFPDPCLYFGLTQKLF
jgi:hypothetical protein